MNAEPFIVEIHDFMYNDEIIDVQEQARFPFLSKLQLKQSFHR